MPGGTLKSRGQLEAEISEATVRFEKEFAGRGPTEAKAYILDDVMLVRLQGALTPAERRLSRAGSETRRSLSKPMRQDVLEKARSLLELIILDVTEGRARRLYADISTIPGVRRILFAQEERIRVAPESD